jgi:hypothetical protein
MATTIKCGNNNVIIINSNLADSDITQKDNNIKQKELNRDLIIREINEFAKANNQSPDWIKNFARDFLGIDYSSCDELSLIQLVNIKKSLQYYK